MIEEEDKEEVKSLGMISNPGSPMVRRDSSMNYTNEKESPSLELP